MQNRSRQVTRIAEAGGGGGDGTRCAVRTRQPPPCSPHFWPFWLADGGWLCSAEGRAPHAPLTNGTNALGADSVKASVRPLFFWREKDDNDLRQGSQENHVR